MLFIRLPSVLHDLYWCQPPVRPVCVLLSKHEVISLSPHGPPGPHSTSFQAHTYPMTAARMSLVAISGFCIRCSSNTVGLRPAIPPRSSQAFARGRVVATLVAEPIHADRLRRHLLLSTCLVPSRRSQTRASSCAALLPLTVSGLACALRIFVAQLPRCLGGDDELADGFGGYG